MSFLTEDQILNVNIIQWVLTYEVIIYGAINQVLTFYSLAEIKQRE